MAQVRTAGLLRRRLGSRSVGWNGSATVPIEAAVRPDVGITDGLRFRARLLVALLATLPIQWQILARTGAYTVKIFHLTAFAFVAAYALGRAEREALGTVLRRSKAFVIPFAYYVLTLLIATLYHRQSMAGTGRQVVYGLIGFAAGGLMYRIEIESDTRSKRTLAWSGLAAIVGFTLLFGASLVAKGIDPARVIVKAIAAADPRIIEFELFKVAFVGFGLTGETARANLRHEVFAAILTATFLAQYAVATPHPRASRLPRFAARTSLVVAVPFVAFSLSRAIIAVLLISAALVASRLLVGARLSPKRAMAGWAIITASIGGLLAGPGGVLAERFFEQTESYANRSKAIGSSVSSLTRTLFLGGDFESQSTHNLILDAWAQGGIVVAAFAAIALGMLAVHWVKNYRRYLRTQDSSYEASAYAPVLGLGILPIVRFLTAGGGTLRLPEWVALGAFFGITAAMANSRPGRPSSARSHSTR